MYQLLATVEFDTIGGDPLDKSHNNFAFQSVDASTPAQGALDAYSMIGNFFETLETGQVHVISGYLSAAISRTPGALFKVYDITGHLNGSPHGSPIYVNQFSLTAAASASSLPEGVSSCLSFHSAYGTDVEFGPGDRPRARDRGRVYLGPLNDNTRALDGTTHRASVATGFRSDVALAATALMAGTHSAGHVQWAVWSRTAAATKLVSGGWIDDRFDYQRRREDQGLIKTTW